VSAFVKIKQKKMKKESECLSLIREKQL